MQNIKVSRYAHPKQHGWAGYFEPGDKSWIMFIGTDNKPHVFLHRDPATGAILGDDPSLHATDIAEIQMNGGLRTGMPHDGSVQGDGLEHGELVFPLGVDGTGGVGIS